MPAMSMPTKVYVLLPCRSRRLTCRQANMTAALVYAVERLLADFERKASVADLTCGNGMRTSEPGH